MRSSPARSPPPRRPPYGARTPWRSSAWDRDRGVWEDDHEQPRRKSGTRDVGGRGIIMIRDGDGAVQVLINTCPHRGMETESRAEGHGLAAD
ncbi:MAG: Rieske 2Fe-2S domain-containing protein [Acidimicrobiia bacterium]|nr:Rieske 2Fe-2S domain-containing protein [Acidimicrobiia bacterium]